MGFILKWNQDPVVLGELVLLVVLAAEWLSLSHNQVYTTIIRFGVNAHFPSIGLPGSGSSSLFDLFSL